MVAVLLAGFEIVGSCAPELDNELCGLNVQWVALLCSDNR